jgi:hypothetical protein
MKNMENTPEREAVIHRMVAIVIEECPWIFNVHSPSYVLRHSWVKNGKSHSISGNYRKYVRVDPNLRRVYWKVENKPNLAVLFYAALLLLLLSFPAVVMKYRRRRK